MSSSRPTMQATAYVASPRMTPLYRQIDYYDGKVLRISESRRRSHVTSSQPPLPAGQIYSPVSHGDAVLSSPISTSPGIRHGASSSERDLGSRRHVTSESRKAKAIIIQNPIPRKVVDVEENPRLRTESPNMPTPPATPRIERLPTPDLSDLDETPFCDCCIEAHVVKYCASCGEELSRPKH
ncbi:hypothetical protein BU26DRAFT_42352 [Trematosphaeria pertusa]|uniref:Uncharacterized protein n=1 Tax=Trematosphaeria pertusa TaxID=390896 RepID=A0A6A6J630_9PLEO|nr:uncharacterized protein BU26DRAFT_42352 [Trematosphaeria pertusa]KAF2257350.1 hypothetical protein BU26DRAFT_42352 [Trematosphaeria pertusa]